MPENPNDLVKTVPAVDPTPSLESLVAECVKFMKGWTDSEGKVHDGLLRQMQEVRDKLEKQEEERKELEKSRLTWKTGLTIATAGALLSQTFGYLKDHFK